MEYMDNATPSEIVSGGFDTEVITLDSDGLGKGSDQPCRVAYIWPEDTKNVRLGNSAANAVAAPILWNDGSYLKLPISNTDKLFFNGTAADKVYILWRT